ncbi:MAG: PDDEXK nuclease domain-containing protein [Ginsengibacter sp.]
MNTGDSLLINSEDKNYQHLLDSISITYSQGQKKAINAVNIQLLEAYWQIGQYIVEFEQGGNSKAEYGKALISNLAKDLTLRHGKGFSRSNVVYMRLLYLRYPISQKPSHQLSWSHFVELLKIEDNQERKFYENQSIVEKWSVPQLKRQKESALFQRLALSKNKEELLKLSAEGLQINQAKDIVKDPYVFEFLKIPEEQIASEQDLENHLCDNLQLFLLELGKGFTYVGRQYRMTINNKHYRADLVFYHPQFRQMMKMK